MPENMARRRRRQFRKTVEAIDVFVHRQRWDVRITT
jgi:hypothetical protein